MDNSLLPKQREITNKMYRQQRRRDHDDRFIQGLPLRWKILHYCITQSWGNLSILIPLIKTGVNDVRNEPAIEFGTGNTALHILLAYKPYDESKKVIKSLIRSNPKLLSFKNDKMETPVHNLRGFLHEGELEILEFILKEFNFNPMEKTSPTSCLLDEYTNYMFLYPEEYHIHPTPSKLEMVTKYTFTGDLIPFVKKKRDHLSIACEYWDKTILLVILSSSQFLFSKTSSFDLPIDLIKVLSTYL